MATAWAGLAFSQDFILPTDEQVGPTSSESSQAARVENTASSHTENEKIVPVTNAGSMRGATSRRLAPAQTTRRVNVNGYLCRHPHRSCCRPMNRLTRPVRKAPRLLQPRTRFRHMRKMKKSFPSATQRSTRGGTSRRLAPAQTTRRSNVNGYLCRHPSRSLLTRPVRKAPRLLQPRTPLRHIRKMKKSFLSATQRSMRIGTSRRLVPAQTIHRGNVNGYLYHHPPRSLSGRIRRARHHRSRKRYVCLLGLLTMTQKLMCCWRKMRVLRTSLPSERQPTSRISSVANDALRRSGRSRSAWSHANESTSKLVLNVIDRHKRQRC
jgi:hypothetical protein